MENHHLAGIYAAALTPLCKDYSVDLDAIPLWLGFLAERGCHGALILGTTGEGPSFSPDERQLIFQRAIDIRQTYQDFKLLAGTGTPSLDETIYLNKIAFDLGFDGVVVLPPYYFRNVSDDGLFTWYSQVMNSSVPSGSPLLGYHIPAISGVPLSIDLIARLKDTFPDQFAGIKDSSSDPTHAKLLGTRFGKDLFVLTGNDRLFTLALESGASGCITALANLASPELRNVWDIFNKGEKDLNSQSRLIAARDVLEDYLPAPPLLKALLPHMSHFPLWVVRPPLEPLSEDLTYKALEELHSALA
jgi:4-hydroxy-tetrahydrodipicolinate synthase